ncbi:hypothetical protein EXS65_00215 [Candidatus Peribacteria bacterium]|nr:hypothetical protein [Candidatus Peribacteria bacterium]
MKFLVNGSIAFDLLLSHEGSFLSGIDAKNLDRLSVNYLAQEYKRHHGGVAANIGWNLALLGHSPLLLGAVGSDGADYVKLLASKGVDMSLVETVPDAATATAVIATDIDERQISFFHPGADGRGTLPDFSGFKKDIAYAIMGPRNPMLMLRGGEMCVQHGIPYLFDPGQLVHAFGKDEFRHAVTGSKGLVVNEYEWGLASGKLGWKEGEVVSACGMLITTLGDKGIRLVTKEEDLVIPACKPLKLVNPTGAGDAARAGLLIGLASKWSLREIGRFAAVLGSLLVEQEGTLLDTLDTSMIQKRAKENYGEELPTL